MNTADVELAVACIAALAWIVRTALTDPVEAVILLGVMFLVSLLTTRFRSRRRRLPPQ
ncbi:hypothetical protein ACOZ4F_20145 (plasmid) [Haloarcula marismortui]|uniref:hypothetical protein n=1 Tax=Haloarcula marismortui TaxID=2238 RepID=UPI003C77FDA3